MEYYHPEPTISQEIEPCPFGEGIHEKIDIVDKSSVRQVVSKGLKSLGPTKSIVIVAQGRQTSKAVTCAEIMKAKKTNAEIHQINRVAFIK
ncbi:unnamed protein product [Allacma fusca]|uniref:DNA/RNA-binding protein Alba-like domain-containing protein n=1 Tax=Allacma fusca TaxID=39272 RepID=A0A8J2KAU1_9HEXA|nr:unnamed protein product [Allacma fusca]